MSDMPDFDSMSPEEMMKWMESLAKRQGATEGLTTDADLEIEEVDESDERLAGMGEYKPYGMSDADWAKMQEREAAEKAAKLAAQQSAPKPAASAPPPPPPAPEPVVAQAAAEPSAGDMPDFDSMSPEEMMEWMESLAVRQGASEGLTTSASMQVAEVDANDERLAGMGEYKPYGMSDIDWAKMQEREAAEKAAKLAARQSTPAPVEAELKDEDVYDEDEEYEYEYDEDYVDMDDEEYFESSEDSEELIMATLDLEDTQEDEPLPSFDDIFPSQPLEEAESPMDWLAGLSAGDDDVAPALDFDMDAFGDLAGLGEAESAGDPMDWLASLSANDDSDAPDLFAIAVDDDDDEEEGSLTWMESLAASQGADEDELFTAADLDIPMPDGLTDDGPGYEEFSFEEATGMVQDTDSMSPIQARGDNPEMSLVDPEGWLDSLASGIGGNEIPDDFFDSEEGIEIPEDFFDDDEYDDYDEAYEDEEGEEFEDLADNVKAQMDSGKLGDSPDDINKFFESAFAKAATRDDVPDYLDSEDDEEVDLETVAMPVQAEIPEWLKESMSAAPSDDDDVIFELEDEPIKKTSTTEMMIDKLFDEEEIAEAEIPDWLQGGMDEDSGVIADDIFDDMVEETVVSFDDLNINDTQDTWVDAFSKEDSTEMQQWYEDAVANLEVAGESSTPVAQPVAAQSAAVVTLQSADLPVESKLDEGTAQNVPDWMSDKAGQSVEVEAVPSDMDWLSEDFDDEDIAIEADVDSGMPDWLQETVDDSVTADEDLPDWLAGETDIAADDIPDWLRETMDEEEESIEAPFPTDFFEEEEVEAPAPTPAPVVTRIPVPVSQSPAPVPVDADKVDAVAYLRSAKEKISARDIDGAMLDYEQIIRANKALPQVEKELQRLAEDNAHKKNPAVSRVLGDVLMRQGKLQEALDTYRKALNML